MTDLTLGITLKADASGFVGEVKVSNEQLDKLGKAGKKAGDEGRRGLDGMSSALGRMKSAVIGTIAAYASFQTVQRFIGAAAREIMAAEKATANLNAVLRATGGTVGLTADELSNMADELERTTLFDDAEIKQAEAVLLTFRQVQGDTFREAIGLATDLAALMGGDLQGAVLQLGKALEDPETGLTALRRSGISFTESQQDLIKSLVETGDRAQAMNIILDTVAGQIGGVAKEQVTGLTGALNQLDDAWGDFLKSLADSKAFDVALAGLRGLTGLIDRLNATGLDAINNQIAQLEGEKSRLAHGLVAARDDPILGFLTDEDADTRRLGEIEAELQQLRDAAAFIRAGQTLTPPPQTTIPPLGGGGGSGETDDARKAREKREAVIKALRFEEEQLGRTAEQQAVYNALHQAGADINSAAGQTIAELVASIQRQTDAQILVDAAQEAYNATMQEGAELTEALRTPSEVYADTIDHLKDLLAQGAINQETFNRAVDLADKTLEKATEKTDEWKDSWKEVGAVSTEALADILLHAKNVGDVLEGLGQQILQILSQKLFAGPLDKLFDGIFESMSTSAQGNVFAGGRILPFAKGGIVTKPVIFPMAQGAGLMGEAGPEAVMPLRRDARGNLGVIAEGGRDGVEINIHNYSGQPVEQRQRQAGDGRTMIDLIIGAVKADLRKGGELAQTFQGTYGLSRKGY
jgi:hypothetical protein